MRAAGISGKLAKQPISFCGSAPSPGAGPLPRTVRRPRFRVHERSAPEAVLPPQRSPGHAAFPSRPKRILIADPDRDVCELFGHLITRIGHEPLSYRPARGETEDPPDVDLLLIEPALPGAFEVARAMRARQPKLPIICASIYPAKLLAASELLALRPIAYLLKPCSLAELKDALEFALAAAAIAETPQFSSATR